jgi:hypothetical protein
VIDKVFNIPSRNRARRKKTLATWARPSRLAKNLLKYCNIFVAVVVLRVLE